MDKKKPSMTLKVILAIAALATAALAFWAMPTPVDITSRQILTPDDNYLPGGIACFPENVNRLPTGRLKDSRVQECATAKRQYAAELANLSAQDRASDASVKQVELASQQVRLSYLQTVGGFLTLIAAIFAAWYAGKAAAEAARSANLAQDSLDLTRKATSAQVRPYVAITGSNIHEPGPFTRDSVMRFHVRNFGKTPAKQVVLRFQDFIECVERLPPTVPIGPVIGDYGLLAPDDQREEIISARSLPLSELGDVLSGTAKLIIRISVEYSWDEGTDSHDVTLILSDPAAGEFTLYQPKRPIS